MATSTQAPGTTFFDRLRRSFTDVPIDPDNANAIATTEFLEAAESLTTLFGAFQGPDGACSMHFHHP